MSEQQIARRQTPQWHKDLADGYDRKIQGAVDDTSGETGSPFDIAATKAHVVAKLAEYHDKFGTDAAETNSQEAHFERLKKTMLQMFTDREILSTKDVEDYYPETPGIAETLDPAMKQRVFADPEVKARIQAALVNGWRNQIIRSLTEVAEMGASLDEVMEVLVKDATAAGLDASAARHLVQGKDTLVKIVPLLFNNPHVSAEFAEILQAKETLSEALEALKEHEDIYRRDLEDRSVGYDSVLSYVRLSYADIEAVAQAEAKEQDAATIEARRVFEQRKQIEWAIALRDLGLQPDVWQKFKCDPEQVDERIDWCRQLIKRKLPYMDWQTFDCHPDQIATTVSEVKIDTKVYKGKVEKEVFAKIAHVERIFIDGHELRQGIVEVGGKTPMELEQMLIAAKIPISPGVVYDSNFVTTDKPKKIRLVSVDYKKLIPFIDQLTDYNDLIKAANAVGLDECPAETAIILSLNPKARESITNIGYDNPVAAPEVYGTDGEKGALNVRIYSIDNTTAVLKASVFNQRQIIFQMPMAPENNAS